MLATITRCCSHHSCVGTPSICGCCFCRPTARSSLRSSASGSSRDAWRHTTATSPPSAQCSTPSTPVSIGGVGPTQYCDGYAALFKTLCLVSFPDAAVYEQGRHFDRRRLFRELVPATLGPRRANPKS